MKMEAYGELIDKIILMEGVKNKLEELHKLYRMTIVSNTHLDYIHKTLQHVGIEKYFEAISSAKDFPHGKPYPEVYLDSLQKLDLGANECVAVEDSHAGVEAAKNASIACIAIPNELTKHQDFSHADIVIPNIAELTPELINKIAPSFQF